VATKRKSEGKAKPGRQHYSSEGSYARRVSARQEADGQRDGRERHGPNDRDEYPEDAGPRADRKWWLCTGLGATQAAFGWADRLSSRQRRQAMLDAIWEAVYKDAPLTAIGDGGASAWIRTGHPRQNIACSAVDTITARIIKRRPMPCISADDAGHQEKLFAKRASRVLRRKMGSSVVERLSPEVCRDGVIRGTGCARVYRDGGDAWIERIPRREVITDPQDAAKGAPRTMARVYRIDRDVLAAQYPERIDDIRKVSRAARDEWTSYDEVSDADMVEVGEFWHLPSVPGGDDGRYVHALRGVAPLCERPWTRVRFPIARFHWESPIDGYWGCGLVEAIAPIQQEVNAILKDLGEGISLGMQLKIFSPRSSNVDKQHLRARNPAVIEHDGAVPTYVAPLPFNPSVLQYLQWRISQAYELAGISQASAASKNPLGSNASGKALDTMYDLESDRFSHVELQYAMFRLELGQLLLDEARDIAMDKDTPKNEKAAWIRQTDWERADVDSGDYHLVLEPINFLPDARSGKLATVKEMSEAGIITDPLQSAALFDEPDIARANRYMLGPYRMLERWIEDLGNLDIPLEELMPTPLHTAYMPLAQSMCQGELCNVIAEASSDDAQAETNEAIQGRYRWALQMLEAESGGVGPDQAMAAGAPPAMPGDPMAAAAPMPMAPDPMMPPSIDPMGGLTAQLAAGMPPPPGMALQ
jgi:hypothetical protein